eukprot:TRINITY_DN15801_c1_g1_i1.p1 TRINITY_DN15801_c1_g1~~TRINITY_DN15801_c1_g1_i1.p1  ORF type:complete len:484 (+),score=150.66 TRINITY_DN15801_c1_g1_i1:165-1454(+)
MKAFALALCVRQVLYVDAARLGAEEDSILADALRSGTSATADLGKAAQLVQLSHQHEDMVIKQKALQAKLEALREAQVARKAAAKATALAEASRYHAFEAAPPLTATAVDVADEHLRSVLPFSSSLFSKETVKVQPELVAKGTSLGDGTAKQEAHSGLVDAHLLASSLVEETAQAQGASASSASAALAEASSQVEAARRKVKLQEAVEEKARQALADAKQDLKQALDKEGVAKAAQEKAEHALAESHTQGASAAAPVQAAEAKATALEKRQAELEQQLKDMTALLEKSSKAQPPASASSLMQADSVVHQDAGKLDAQREASSAAAHASSAEIAADESGMTESLDDAMMKVQEAEAKAAALKAQLAERVKAQELRRKEEQEKKQAMAKALEAKKAEELRAAQQRAKEAEDAAAKLQMEFQEAEKQAARGS